MRPYRIYTPYHLQPIPYRILARILSFIFRIIVGFRNYFYDKDWFRSYSLPGKCLSVGNLSVGGTGKSPFVMELAQDLSRRGCEVAILTRGYGSSLHKDEILVLLAGKILAKNFDSTLIRIPDEALMQSQKNAKVPIIVSAKRKEAAFWFLENTKMRPTHWLLDDGFQHRRLKRDIDIVLLDSQYPFGNSFMLPLGSLREPMQSLRRAHFVIFTRANETVPSQASEDSVTAITKAPISKIAFDVSLRSSNPLLHFSRSFEPALLMLGIAQPERVVSQIEEMKIHLGGSYCVGDHEPFSPEIVQTHMSLCKSIITTEKDYWRDPSIFENAPCPYFILDLALFPIESGKDSVFDRIYRSINSH